MAALVSITIVTWNRWPLLEQCLRSVQRQSHPHREIIVVDQGSSDGTASQITRQFPDVHLIANTDNTLYCRGQNQAIRAARGEYVLALNNDVVLHPEFLAQAVRAMGEGERIVPRLAPLARDDPERGFMVKSRGPSRGVGMVCGKVLSWDARHLDGAGQEVGRWCQAEDRGYRQRDCGQFDAPAEVFGPGVAAPLYRCALLEDVAEEGRYFDEQLGCFFEDLDLAWRAQRHGWRARYTPQAVAYHYRGATAQGPRPRWHWLAGYDATALPYALRLRYVRNRWRFMIKHRAWMAGGTRQLVETSVEDG